MRIDLSNMMTTTKLAALGQSLEAAHVFVVSVLPGRAIRVVHSSSPSPSMNRLYHSAGQFVDAPAWEAILTGNAVSSTDLFLSRPDARTDFHAKWLGRLGYAHAIAAPLNAPVFSGYPGALIALGSVGQPAFTPAALQSLAEAADQISESTSARFTARAPVSNRLFIATGNGTFKGALPHDVLEPTLAANLETIARNRLSQQQRTSPGDRIQLLDSHGEACHFAISLQESYPAIANGRVLLLAAVPDFTEWLTLTPSDFDADPEIGRLLPAFKFMFDHFHEGATLTTISSYVHLSPFHFHRRFTELLGITPKHFLFDCQIARTQKLLLSAEHELESIAKMCGFAHQSHFTSRFKQATGMTPTRWRKSHTPAARDATSLERARAV